MIVIQLFVSPSECPPKTMTDKILLYPKYPESATVTDDWLPEFIYP